MKTVTRPSEAGLLPLKTKRTAGYSRAEVSAMIPSHTIRTIKVTARFLPLKHRRSFGRSPDEPGSGWMVCRPGPPDGKSSDIGSCIVVSKRSVLVG